MHLSKLLKLWYDVWKSNTKHSFLQISLQIFPLWDKGLHFEYFLNFQNSLLWSTQICCAITKARLNEKYTGRELKPNISYQWRMYTWCFSCFHFSKMKIEAAGQEAEVQPPGGWGEELNHRSKPLIGSSVDEVERVGGGLQQCWRVIHYWVIHYCKSTAFWDTK